MSKDALNGLMAIANKSTRGTLLDALDVLPDNTWVEVVSVGVATTLPVPFETAKFKTPDATAAAPITLAAGDSVYPLTIEQICKTDLELSLEEGTIDTTDDCGKGFTAMIHDGFKSITGTLNGFLKQDSVTKRIINGLDLLGRYFDVVEDDGAGVYQYTDAANESFDLFVCLNKDAKIGDDQNWLIFPILITTLGTGAGLKEAQKRDLAFVKGEGLPVYYIRTVLSAADEI